MIQIVNKKAKKITMADSMLIVGIACSIFYWLFEYLFEFYLSAKPVVYKDIFGFDITFVGSNIILFCIFLIFGSHAQYTMKNRIKAENALKKSEEKYRTILENIKEAYYEIDSYGKLSFFNDSLNAITGYSKTELKNASVTHFLDTENSEKFVNIFQKVRESGESIKTFDLKLLTKKKTSCSVEISISPIDDSNGNNLGVRGILRDVTKKRKTEKKLYESYVKVQNARQTTILGLAKLAEYRDKSTGNHLERVREYSKLIARHLAKSNKYKGYITNEYIEDIFHSSVLHDIGKVGISDSILLKPGKLTYEEFEEMKRHTTFGGDVLTAVDAKIKGQSFLTMGKEIAYYHHEKWNGKGYPKGLKGDEIPLSARIVALADTYDALTSKRSYKEAFTEENTKNIIIGDKGKHFDPDVVNAFIANTNKFYKIREELQGDV